MDPTPKNDVSDLVEKAWGRSLPTESARFARSANHEMEAHFKIKNLAFLSINL
jgi:hypothetical protein